MGRIHLRRNDMAKRGRPRKSEMGQAVLVKEEHFEKLEQMPLDTFEDYDAYNKSARTLGIPVKIPPLHMHPHVRCKVTRLDNQGSNAIRVRKRDATIDFDETVFPGKEVELPIKIVDFLHTLNYPQYKQIQHGDGTSETVFSHNMPRFAVQVLGQL